MPDAITETRHRELAVEHLLFRTMRHVERQHPGLLDSLDASLDKLGDPTQGGQQAGGRP